MLQLPPLPAWDALHPLVIHFPIVLLLLSPLFLLAGILLPSKGGKYYGMIAAVLLVIGTGCLFVSASTGEAAAELADRGGGVNAVLETHEQLAEQTRIIFSALSVILVGMMATFRILRRQETRLAFRYLPLAFLALYSVGAMSLVNTAHAGGRLVHEFGVHALLPETTAPAADPASQKPTGANGEVD